MQHLIKNGAGDFVPFSGITKTVHNRYVRITLSTGKEIHCSENHRFVYGGRTLIGSLVQPGDYLSDSIYVAAAETVEKTIELYDPIDVAGTHTFEHDGIISHNCNFQGSADTLIGTDTLLALKSEKPIREQYGVKYYAEPVEDGEYFMTVDVGKGRGLDYSTLSVFGMIDGQFKQVCTFRDNMISPLIFPELIVRAGKIFNNALVIIENNDAGIVVCNTVYYDYEYPNVYTSSSVKANGIGVMMTEKVKRIGCSNLRDLLESGKLKVVDPDTIIELCTFIPKAKSYAAANGCHDDMVMPLVLFAWFLSTPMFTDMSLVDLRELMYREKLEEMEESVPPWGYYQDSGGTEAPLNPAAMAFYEEQKQQLAEFEF